MALQENLQRVEVALGRLGRITNSPKADADRCKRAGVAPIPPVAQRILRHLVERGPARISDVARATRTGDASISRQVTQLEALGLLRRESDERDGRAALVLVTEEGQRISARLRSAADAIFQERLAGWSSSQLESLGSLMERLANDLGAQSQNDVEPKRGR